MELMDKLGEKRSRARAGLMESKLDRSKQRESEVEAENRVLRDQLDRAERQQVRLGKLLEHPAPKKAHRLRWLVLGGLLTWAVGTERGRRQVNGLAEKVMDREAAKELKARAERTAERIAHRANEVSARSAT